MKPETSARIYQIFYALYSLLEKAKKYGVKMNISLDPDYGWLYEVPPRDLMDNVKQDTFVWREDDPDVFYRKAIGAGDELLKVVRFTDGQVDFLLESIEADALRVMREIRDAVEYEKREDELKREFSELLAKQPTMKAVI